MSAAVILPAGIGRIIHSGISLIEFVERGERAAIRQIFSRHAYIRHKDLKKAYFIALVKGDLKVVWLVLRRLKKQQGNLTAEEKKQRAMVTGLRHKARQLKAQIREDRRLLDDPNLPGILNRWGRQLRPLFEGLGPQDSKSVVRKLFRTL